AGTANWTLITITSGIPSTSNLRIRFTQSSATTQFRIDDVKLNSVSASCTLTLGTTVTACTVSTSLLDNYTVTIPYTGGANATYTITTSGAVSGDNPTSVAAGNIIVTFTEGTAYSVTITGGTCNLNASGASPECKIPNTLPFSEPFNYPASSALSNSQKWTNVSLGSDEILAVATNLTYTGITSTGGSVTFAGTGSDTKAPFTTVNSDVIYVSFLSSVTDITGVTGTSYFAILSDVSNSFTTARIWIKNDGTQYQYGLSPTTSAVDIVWSTNLYSVGTTQYLVLRHNFSSNTLSLFENPTIGGTASSTINVTPTAPITNFAGFILRQESATTTPVMTIDELTINTVPNFTLSSSSFNAIEGLTMYPNPLKGNTLFLTSAANADMSVQIFDIVGKEVVKSTVINNSVNVSGLNTGVYIVKVTEEGKTATRKLVIQ
ncbi:MAG: T9SS type A sorting domain-containing protein, partial [Bacteroidia bacterium]